MEVKKLKLGNVNYLLHILILISFFCSITASVALISRHLNTNAANFSNLKAPTIQLSSPVQKVSLKNGELPVPDEIVGAFSVDSSKTLLLGHSSTVFHNLHRIKIGESIEYNHLVYRVTKIVTSKKSNINMGSILSPAKLPTLVLMTCAGKPLNDNQDYSHRLIVTAQLNQSI